MQQAANPITSVQKFIKSLYLYNFRSYSCLKLEDISDGIVVLYGNNGVGKTNLLEAISIISGQKGLRSSKLNELINFDNNDHQPKSNPFAKNMDCIIDLGVQDHISIMNLSVGISKGLDNYKKSFALNGVRIKESLNEMVPMLWLTPQMDLFFIESCAKRRKFLDRIVQAFYPMHSSSLNKLDYLNSQRLKIIKYDSHNELLLTTIESQISKLGVSIAAARVDVIEKLNKAIADFTSLLALNRLELQCVVGQKLQTANNAIDVEEEYRDKLKYNRISDKASGMSSYGVQRSDLQVFLSKKKGEQSFANCDTIEARFCSTGEQKLLVITIVLTAARILGSFYQTNPILLLDEVIAHLDRNTRQKLFDELKKMQLQVWMSAVSKEYFTDLDDSTTFFKVTKDSIIRE